ncbi:MAG: alpha/beta fold hydrolase [Alphaproteobacteria bacterium]|nr:alpha/beta fold hydrolase [Alphaproteobacteria bacterium]
MLAIRTFGSLQVVRDGEPLPLPASRKTRALLGYLALSGAPQRQERLCELFWDVPDDPRGALRWSLSKLRPIVNDDASVRLIADRERVSIDMTEVGVDLDTLRTLADSEDADLSLLRAAWDSANDTLLVDCDLPNQDGFAAWLEAQRNEAALLRMKIARRIALSPDLTPQDAEIWALRWAKDAPFEAAAMQHAVRARRRMGRPREADALAEDFARIYREAGLEPPAPGREPAAAAAPPAPETEFRAPRQSIRFVRAPSGLSLAWATVGDAANPPLVKAANWLSHLELDWEAPIWSPLFRELAQSFYFVRYDERGCGLSDWDVADISFETFVDDLALVADAAGVERFPLLGISQGSAVSIEFAARYPERVSHLILFGGYAAGWRHTATAAEAREREAVMVLTEQGWGRPNPAYRHLFSKTFMPTATAEELEWFDEFQRRTTSPENAVRFLHAFADIDVRHRLKDIAAPTLVVHSLNDLRVPSAQGRDLAAAIPNAEFVGLDSPNHLLLGREGASADFIAAVRNFLRR